jgi:hypothetical protein
MSNEQTLRKTLHGICPRIWSRQISLADSASDIRRFELTADVPTCGNSENCCPHLKNES